MMIPCQIAKWNSAIKNWNKILECDAMLKPCSKKNITAAALGKHHKTPVFSQGRWKTKVWRVAVLQNTRPLSHNYGMYVQVGAQKRPHPLVSECATRALVTQLVRAAFTLACSRRSWGWARTTRRRGGRSVSRWPDARESRSQGCTSPWRGRPARSRTWGARCGRSQGRRGKGTAACLKHNNRSTIFIFCFDIFKSLKMRRLLNFVFKFHAEMCSFYCTFKYIPLL